jgi:hypothetical protein
MGSHSLLFSTSPRKPLMLLALPALAAAGPCPLNRDSNDNAYPLARRIDGQVHAMLSSRDFAAFPAFPPEVVAVSLKSTHYEWGSPANSDIYANYANRFSSAGKRGACRERWTSDERCKEQSRREASAQLI